MVLHTVAAQLARASSPRHLQLYGLDMAGHGLHALRRLPHCGDVIGADDHEGTARLLSTVLKEVDARGRRFAEAGVATLAQYHALCDEADRPPRIVILLDSYAGFTSTYELLDGGALPQMLQRVIGEGRAAGVHVIATADRRNAVPPPVLALVSQRIVLRLASEDEYPTLGLDRKGVEGAALPPGRGFVDDTVELQIALADLERDVAVTAADGERAPAIPRMPEIVRRADLPATTEPAHPVLGIEEAGLTAAAAHLTDAPFLVCGPYRSGRTTALATLVDSMLEADPELEVHVLLPRRSGLAGLGDRVASVARGAEACAESARALQELVAGRSPDAEHPLCVVIVDDVDELADPSAAVAGQALETVLRRGRDVNVRVIASCETSQARSFSSLLRELRKDGNGLLLEPNVDVDGDLLGVRLPRRSRLQLPPGRGFLVDNGLPVLVQVADRPL
jgi:S-DNA-T family DNA segregation ATPase FtsK/SpoIIIE